MATKRKAVKLPSDKAVTALVIIYKNVSEQLDIEILDAAAAGQNLTADKLLAKRARVQALLTALTVQTRPLLVQLGLGSYVAGQDFMTQQMIKKGLKKLGLKDIVTEFGPRDNEAVKILAENMVRKIEDTHIMVGRRYDDVLRQVALQQTSESIALGEGRVELSERLDNALTRAGVTITNEGGVRLVPINDRNYRLEKYVEMVARTTSREAASEGMANRLLSNGLDLIEIAGTNDDVCAEYFGQDWSLNGQTPGYDIIDQLPPFHPNCTCVVTPASLT